jgi:hypothetical protein
MIAMGVTLAVIGLLYHSVKVCSLKKEKLTMELSEVKDDKVKLQNTLDLQKTEAMITEEESNEYQANIRSLRRDLKRVQSRPYKCLILQ